MGKRPVVMSEPKKILIVDDEIRLMQMMREALPDSTMIGELYSG